MSFAFASKRQLSSSPAPVDRGLKHLPELSPEQLAIANAQTISLTQAAEFLDCPLSGGQALRNQAVYYPLGSGRRITVGHLHFFDPRGCRVQLENDHGDPFIDTAVWSGRHLATVIDFFLYLNCHPAVFHSEALLAKYTQRYNHYR